MPPSPAAGPARYSARRRSLTDAEIITLYAELQDSAAVAERAGCSSMTVLAIVRAAGQPVRPVGGARGHRLRLNLTAAEIVQRYRAGETGQQIARDAGCSRDVVYRILREEREPLRPGGCVRRARPP